MLPNVPVLSFPEICFHPLSGSESDAAFCCLTSLAPLIWKSSFFFCDLGIAKEPLATVSQLALNSGLSGGCLLVLHSSGSASLPGCCVLRASHQRVGVHLSHYDNTAFDCWIKVSCNCFKIFLKLPGCFVFVICFLLDCELHDGRSQV